MTNFLKLQDGSGNLLEQVYSSNLLLAQNPLFHVGKSSLSQGLDLNNLVTTDILNKGLTNWIIPIPGRTGIKLYDIKGNANFTNTGGGSLSKAFNGRDSIDLLKSSSQAYSGLITIPQSIGAVSLLIRPNTSYDVTNGDVFFAVRTNTPGVRLFDMTIDSLGALRFGWYGPGGESRTNISGSGYYTVGRWTDYTVAWNTTATSVIVNGTVVSTTATVPSTWDTSATTAYIGYNNYPGQLTYTNMTFGSLRVYNVAVTVQDLVNLYQEGLLGFRNTLRSFKPSTTKYFVFRPTSTIVAGSIPNVGSKIVDLGKPLSDHPLNYKLNTFWLPTPNNKGNYLNNLTKKDQGAITGSATWSYQPNGFPGLNLYGGNKSAQLTTPAYAKINWPITLCVWCQVKGTPTDNAIIWGTTYDNIDSSPYLGYALYWTTGGSSAGNPVLGLGYNAGGSFGWASATTISATSYVGKWIFIAAVFTSTATGLYINGASVQNTTSGTATSAGNPTYASTSLLSAGTVSSIARNANIIFGAGWVYNRQLDVPELNALYNETVNGFPNILRYCGKEYFGFMPTLSPPATGYFNRYFFEQHIARGSW